MTNLKIPLLLNKNNNFINFFVPSRIQEVPIQTAKWK